MKFFRFLATVLFALVVFLFLETYVGFYDWVMGWVSEGIELVESVVQKA